MDDLLARLEPLGYSLSENGIEVIRGSKPPIQIATRPVWISRFGHTLSGDRWVELSGLDARGQRIQTWLERHHAFDRAKILGTARIGFAVTSETASALVQFLAAQEALAIQVAPESVRILDRMQAVLIEDEADDGSPRRRWGFMVGADWVGPRSVSCELSPGREPQAKAWTPKGSIAGWVDKWREVSTGSPCNRWLVSSAFAGSLVRILEQRTFILHHYGASSRGKSAIAFFAQSAFGSKRTALSFFGTELGRIEAVQSTSDLPCLFDELQVADKDPRSPDHRRFIYAVCNESPRVRSGQAGGVMRSWTDWKTVVRTTGEEPILRWTRLAGESNRVLEFETPAFNASEQAISVHRWIESEAHVGMVGRAFLGDVARRASLDLPGLRTMFASHVDAIEGKLDILRRGWISVVTCAEQIFLERFLGYDERAAWRLANEDAARMVAILEAIPTDTDADRFTQWLISHRSSNPGLYTTNTQLERGDQYTPRRLVGIETADAMMYFPMEIDAEVTRAGFVAEAAWRAMRVAGRIEATQPGRNQIQRRVAGRRQWIYLVPKR